MKYSSIYVEYMFLYEPHFLISRLYLVRQWNTKKKPRKNSKTQTFTIRFFNGSPVQLKCSTCMMNLSQNSWQTLIINKFETIWQLLWHMTLRSKSYTDIILTLSLSWTGYVESGPPDAKSNIDYAKKKTFIKIFTRNFCFFSHPSFEHALVAIGWLRIKLSTRAAIHSKQHSKFLNVNNI